MNGMSRLFRLLSIILILMASTSQTFVAQAADATSFNPVPISITAKGAGGVPIGAIVAWPVATNPEDWDKWLECNGQTIDAGVYPELAALMGATVPDFRGLFLRGHGSQSHVQANGTTVGMTSTLHESGALGMVQGDAARRVTGAFTVMHAGGWPYTGPFAITDIYYGSGYYGWPADETRHVSFDTSRVTPVASESRPANMAVRYLIRAVK